jgi:succinyl-CoA synthetase beta subunit
MATMGTIRLCGGEPANLRDAGGGAIAEGVIAACKAVSLLVPRVVRVKGTNEDLGK